MKFWVGVTDNGWFDFLSRSGADEVNFWQPGGSAPFTRLEPGAPFLFKLKRPNNHIAGGGTFVKFSKLPLSLAWEVFEEKNGAASRGAFEGIIRSLISDGSSARDPEIGCTVLTEPYFWPRSDWIPNPVNWSGNIVRGRYYDTDVPEEAELWSDVAVRLSKSPSPDGRNAVREEAERYGEPTLLRPRLGQGAFRVVVTDAYQRRCAITGENTLPVLEAAHIRPYSDEGPNEVENGLLLRSDFHRLFDAGLVTVTSEFRVAVSPKIREQWFNGKPYYRLHGKEIANLPHDPTHRPSPEFLDWHNRNRFLR